VPTEVVTSDQLAAANDDKKPEEPKKRRNRRDGAARISMDQHSELQWHIYWAESQLLKYTQPSQRQRLATILGVSGSEDQLPNIIIRSLFTPPPPLELAPSLAASAGTPLPSPQGLNTNRANQHAPTFAASPLRPQVSLSNISSKNSNNNNTNWVPSEVNITPDTTLPLIHSGGDNPSRGDPNLVSPSGSVIDGGAQHHDPVILHFHDDGTQPDMIQATPSASAAIEVAPLPQSGPRGTHFSPLVSVTQILRQRSQADMQPMYTSDL
jgi:hypothetical protein